MKGLARGAACLAVATAALAHPAEAPACTTICAPAKQMARQDLRDLYDSTPIVVLGRVGAVAAVTEMPDVPPEYADRLATLEVIREWKGSGRAAYRLRTSCCGASCGYPFTVGQVHLFFLSRDGESISGGCPDPPKDHVRATIRRLDKLTKRKRLEMPAELR